MITHRHRLAVLILVACIVAAPCARADDSLFRDLGGKDKIAAFTNDFVDRLLQDSRIKTKFSNANIPHLKQMLTEQFCNLAGGPVDYTGLGMAQAHAGMGIRNADFNALAEDLQFAMDAAGISFFTQNRLIALLAPMQHDIVTK